MGRGFGVAGIGCFVLFILFAVLAPFTSSLPYVLPVILSVLCGIVAIILGILSVQEKQGSSSLILGILTILLWVLAFGFFAIARVSVVSG